MSRKFPVNLGDQVTIIAGGAKGQSGAVTSLNREKMTVTVENSNIRKKAVKPSDQNPQGGFIDLEGPVHVSNVALTSKLEAKKAK